MHVLKGQPEAIKAKQEDSARVGHGLAKIGKRKEIWFFLKWGWQFLVRGRGSGRGEKARKKSLNLTQKESVESEKRRGEEKRKG